VIVLPMLPMVLEALNHEGNIQTDSILLTTAILAAGFLLTAGGPAFLTGYGLMFGWALLIVYGEAKVVAAASNAAPKLADPIPDLQSQDWGVILRFETWNLSHPMVLFVFVCVLQIIERVIWHIADDKPIFEKLKRS
jgi:hypothetical protein